MNYKEKSAALIASISILLMALSAGFAFGFVHNSIVNQSIEITLQNLLKNKTLFYAEIAGWIIIFITDIVVSGALFILYAKVNRQISGLTAFLRIIYTSILGVAFLN